MELVHDLNYLLISPHLFRKSWTLLQSILSVSEPQQWPQCFCHSAKSGDDGAIPAHQLWEAFDEVTWCTQGKGGAGGGPAALFMPPSARSPKALPHTPVASEFRCRGGCHFLQWSSEPPRGAPFRPSCASSIWVSAPPPFAPQTRVPVRVESGREMRGSKQASGEMRSENKDQYRNHNGSGRKKVIKISETTHEI